MKQAIILAGFGTMSIKAKKNTTDIIEEQFKRKFLEFNIFQVFLSNIIIEKIKKENNIQIHNLSQLLEILYKENYDKVFIQPLNIIKGIEYEKILEEVELYKEKFQTIKIGKPLLNDKEDFEIIKNFLEYRTKNYKIDEGLVLMGHGNKINDDSYMKLDNILKDKAIFIYAMEGYPDFNILLERLNKFNVNKIILSPFLLFSGKHVRDEMASKEKSSLKSKLEDKGFNVDICLKGLGEYTEIQNLYLEKAKKLIRSEKRQICIQ